MIIFGVVFFIGVVFTFSERLLLLPLLYIVLEVVHRLFKLLLHLLFRHFRLLSNIRNLLNLLYL